MYFEKVNCATVKNILLQYINKFYFKRIIKNIFASNFLYIEFSESLIFDKN